MWHRVPGIYHPVDTKMFQYGYVWAVETVHESALSATGVDTTVLDCIFIDADNQQIFPFFEVCN